MKRSIPLRLRVTLVCGVVLAACCLLLTLTHSHYAYEMADAIEAIPLEPAQAAEMTQSLPMEQITLAQEATRPARQAFRFQSLAAMAVIVVLGCGMVYWLTGKALAPLHQLDAQIRGRTAADLGRPLPVPASADEVRASPCPSTRCPRTSAGPLNSKSGFPSAPPTSCARP